MKLKDIKEIKKLISQGDLEKSIHILISLMEDKDELNDVILLSGRLNSLTRQERMGLLSFEQIAIEKNKIVDSFLSLEVMNEKY